MKKINKFSKLFTSEEIKNIVKVKNEYFLVNKELQKFNKEIKESDSQNVLSPQLGILLGTVKKERFNPSLYFLELLSKKTTNKVFINEKAEWLFMCGRDVFKENITKNNSTNEKFLVQNEKDENLGLGKFEKKNSTESNILQKQVLKKGKNIMVMNLMDRGDYLRREMSKRN